MPNPKRCAELWFDDGTLVIEVYERRKGSEDLTPTISFRVYGGMIKQLSDGVLDLQSMDKLKPEKTAEGCPVLPLYDDRAEDVTNLLRAIHWCPALSPIY